MNATLGQKLSFLAFFLAPALALAAGPSKQAQALPRLQSLAVTSTQQVREGALFQPTFSAGETEKKAFKNLFKKTLEASLQASFEDMAKDWMKSASKDRTKKSRQETLVRGRAITSGMGATSAGYRFPFAD